MTYKQMVRKVIKEANKSPMETLRRVSNDRSLRGTDFARYRPNKTKGG